MIFYFGTFNPVHKGHLKIGSQVSKYYNDVITYVPAYCSPWKQELNNYEHRVNMLKLCNVTVDTIEQKLKTPSYTSRTVKALIELYYFDRLKFIIGYDQLLNIYHWHDWQYLRDNCFFIVIPRNTDQNIMVHLAKLHADGFKMSILLLDNIPMSSTDVREGNLEMVMPQVKQYILDNKLY